MAEKVLDYVTIKTQIRCKERLKQRMKNAMKNKSWKTNIGKTNRERKMADKVLDYVSINI